jgi:hypothetical protein
MGCAFFTSPMISMNRTPVGSAALATQDTAATAIAVSDVEERVRGRL